MTENEAIKVLTDIHTNIGTTKCDDVAWRKLKPAMDTAVNALEEIQQYRAIGTVEEIESINFSSNQLRLVNLVEEYKENIKEYEAIGTVEECREARERQKPKKANIWGDGYDDSGNMIYDMYNCPNCGKSYEVDYHDYKFCPECGQAIDRSDLDKLV